MTDEIKPEVQEVTGLEKPVEVLTPSLVITPSDTLVFQYLPLDPVDMNNRFMWRFMKPIPLTWQQGDISFLSLIQNFNNDMNLALMNFASVQWAQLINKLKEDSGGEIPAELTAIINIQKIELRKAEIQ
jgi:hypothetical protein